MKTSNSNLKERRTSIGIASLLVLIPMLFAIMGTSLVNQADSVDGGKIKELEAEIRNLEAQHLEFENEQLAFYVEMSRIDSIFIAYRELQQQYLVLKDSVDNHGIISRIQKLENTFNSKIDQLERVLVNKGPFEKMQINLLDQKREAFNNFKEMVRFNHSYNDCLAGNVGTEELQIEIDRQRDVNLILRQRLRDCLDQSTSGSSNASELRQALRDIDGLEEQLRREQDAHGETRTKVEQLKREKINAVVGYTNICETAKDGLVALKTIQTGLGLNCKKEEIKEQIDETIKGINKGMQDLQIP